MDGTRTPIHLWIVGGLSALWNAFGCLNYLMTQTRNPDFLAAFTPEQRAYFENFPPAMEAAWAFGVWGAIAGSLLLLVRSRHAVAALAVSLAGLAISTFYQYVLASPPPVGEDAWMAYMPIVIWAIAIALLVYALRMRRRRVLR